jgi:hypothetical protein
MPRPDLEKLYQDFVAAPFPRVGGSVGLFAAYDGFIAGYASRAIKGEPIAASALLEPDQDTAAYVKRLRTAENRSAEEADFLRYFDLLEQVLQAISDEPVDLHVPLLDEGTDVWVIAKGQRVGPRTYIITAFEIDLAAQDAKPAFDVGTLVHVDGGDAKWTGGVIVGTTQRVAVRVAA